MSLRSLVCESNSCYAQILRPSLLTRHAILQPSSPCPRATHFTHNWPRKSFPLASQISLLQGSLFGAPSRSVHTLQDRNQDTLAQKYNNESSAPNPRLCTHCGGKTTPKTRKLIVPGDSSKGWHCKPCVRNIRVHGHLPNEEQLAAIKLRRFILESGEASKPSPCRHCGDLTTPRTNRKFVDAENPFAGFHCRTCVRHLQHHGAFPHEDELEAFKTRKRPIRSSPQQEVTESAEGTNEEHPSPELLKSPKQSRDPQPCRHCGEETSPNRNRRLVEPRNPAAGYYCQPCARCLIETDALPSTAQIESLKKLREKLMAKQSPRRMPSPCRHCGDITTPGSKRKLLDPKNTAGGYYCRACAECLSKTNSLPDKTRLIIRNSREEARLFNLRRLKALAVSPLEGESQTDNKDNKVKECAH